MLKIEREMACSEALAAYNLLEESAKNKIPKEMVEYFEKNASSRFEINLRADVPLEMQYISEKGWQLIKAMSEYI